MIHPEVYAYLGSGLLAVAAVPQLLRIVRERHADGVSVSTWLVTLAAIVSWMWYGVHTGSMPQLPGNAVATLTAAGIVVLSWRLRGRGKLATWAPIVVLVCLLSTVLAFGGPGWSAAFGIGLAVIGRLPQTIESWRSMRLRARTTVSVPTWLLITIGQGLWLVYGLLYWDVPVIWVNIVVGLGALVIVVLEKMRPGRLPYEEALALASTNNRRSADS